MKKRMSMRRRRPWDERVGLSGDRNQSGRVGKGFFAGIISPRKALPFAI